MLKTFIIDKDKGSLAVEATLVLTIYLMVLITCVNYIKAYDVYTTMNSIMYETARSLIQYGMDEENDMQEERELCKDMLKDSLPSKLNKKMIENNIDINIVNGGYNGMNYSKTNLDAQDNIELVSLYNIRTPIRLEFLKQWGIKQKTTIRRFSGNLKQKSNKKFVYITKTGNVYHTNVQCSYLLIKKKKVSLVDIDKYRNIAGAKYYECKECNKGVNRIECVYITNYGTSYHYLPTCSTLNRTVIPVDTSEIRGRELCDRCRTRKG